MFNRDDGIGNMISVGKRSGTDEGYRGDPNKVPNAKKVSRRNPFDSKEVKKFKQRVKARHETFNSRLKNFKILSEDFRSTGATRLEKHRTVVEACCVLVQFEMENGRPLFKV